MLRPRDPQHTLRANPKLLVIAALATSLLLVLWVHPSVAGQSAWEDAPDETAADETTAQPLETRPEPVRLSVLDVLGKVSVAVLLIYGVCFALAKYRLWNPQPRTRRSRFRAVDEGRLQLQETLPLPRHEGTLYLMELDGQPILVSATSQQVAVAWSPARHEDTASFAPVSEPAPETMPDFAAIYQTAQQPATPKVTVRPARGESEWAAERSQLISALMRAE